MPRIISEFIKVPEELEREKQLLSTIDYQFEYLQSLIISIKKEGTIKSDKVLVLPTMIFVKLRSV